jgi:cobalt-zinc-cadmium efflux system membrane fusion protein
MNTFKFTAASLMLCLTWPLSAQDEHGHEEEEIEFVEMTVAEMSRVGVSTGQVASRTLSEKVRMPAEVVVNAYESANVTTRITAQVVARHAKLGDLVEEKQPLATLSSVEMAEAQGALILADSEWQRVKSLGKQAVSERRFTEAQIASRQALSRVLAYGMTGPEASRLLASGDAALATGEFDLLAPQHGTILTDNFVVGELIEPGRVLFRISDESTLWVEASTVPTDVTEYSIGAPARIAHGEGHWIEGRVVQLHHQLDETTRRQGIRIEVDNSDDHLHPGQFVEAEISAGDGPTVLAIPDSAITLIEGAPTVFRLLGDEEFHPQPVTTGRAAGGWTEIREGLAKGDEIAIEGVFNLKSLLLKATLGEGHAH